MTRLIRAICAATLAAASLSAAPAPIVTLAVPGRASANASITASGDVVAVAWGAATETGATDIYAAVSRDAGRTFTAPVRVNAARTGAQISGEQPPRVALVPRPAGDRSVVIVWTSKGTSGTQLLTARSNDGGKSFGEVTTVPGSDAAGNRGWQAIATQGDGRVAAIWLDHRETARTAASTMPMPHDGAVHNHGVPADGAAKALLSKLYFGRVDGVDVPRFIASGVCYCCKTTFSAGADGSLYAAWRHVYPGNIRDIAFSLSRDGGRTFSNPVRVSEDQWKLDGCPENGPAMAVGAQGRVHLIWPTLVPGSTTDREPTLGVFYASSTDGLRFSARQQLATEGTPYHPQLAISAADGSLLAVWDELKSGRRRVAAARGRIGAAQETRFVREEIAAAASGSYPVVAASRVGFVVAWTDTSQTPSRIVLQRMP